MKRKIISKRLFAGTLFSVMLIASVGQAFASSKSEVQQKKSNLQSQLNNVQSEISTMEAEKNALEENIRELDNELIALSDELLDLEGQMEVKEEEIETTQEDLSVAKDDEAKQYEDMKLRIRYMYENGNGMLLEVLLQAENITDLLNKAEYISQLSTYDRDMLDRYKETKDEIATLEVQLKDEYAELEVVKVEVEEQQEAVESKIEEKNEQIQVYAANISDSTELAWLYQEEIVAQDQIIAQIEEQERIAAEKAAAEAAAAAAAAAEAEKASSDTEVASAAENNTSTSTSAATEKKETNNNTNTETKTESTPAPTPAPAPTPEPSQPETSAPQTSSGFIYPVSGSLSSDYGYRTHPITGENKMHNGIDWSAGYGTPIYAAGSGTIVSAGYDGSMGNYVIISHGNGVNTVYMHCSSFAKTSGSVNQGEVIAYVGSTGSSTGNHLHFSVTVNGSYVNPWNYL